jgi:stage V sporulation protein AC
MDQQMKQKQREYKKLVDKMSPSSEMTMSLARAFVVGGLICVVGQLIRMLGTDVLNISEEDVSAFTSAVMVFLGATLTGFGVYDKIGKFAGAGSIVPITGFANSVVAPAMEFKREGYVMGVGAKLFSLAGPVLVYGISSSIAVGVIYYLIGLIGD